jgi:hypothetical protein
MKREKTQTIKIRIKTGEITINNKKNPENI